MIKRGVASVLFGTDVFSALATAEAKAFGVEELPMLLVPHPLGVRSEAEIDNMAKEKANEFMQDDNARPGGRS